MFAIVTFHKSHMYSASLEVVRNSSQTMMSVSEGRDTVGQYVTFGVEGR